MPEGDLDSVRKVVAAAVASYDSRRPRYVTYAAFLSQVLGEATRKLAPLAIVQTRAKEVHSFADKLLRKRLAGGNSTREFTDLCGARVITRTRSEVEALSSFIEENFEVDWENSLDTSKRLRAAEFGYRSVHYIVTLRSDIPYGLEVPKELVGLKAEVQVRTLAEHAWADFAHDLTYKGAFDIPEAWQRELAGLAARLEAIDEGFARIEERLGAYATSFGAYLDEDEMRQEIDRLEIMLEYDPRDARVAARIGKLAITLSDFQKAVAVMRPLVDPSDAGLTHQPLLRDLGVAFCKLHRDEPGGADYRQGQAWLEEATRQNPNDVDALAALAGTWKGVDDQKTCDLYARAVEVDSGDPYAVGNHVECVLRVDPSRRVLLRPLIREALGRCRAHIEVGINMPWAYYDLGKFYMLLDEPYESLDAYAKALSASTADWMIETSLKSLDRLSALAGELEAYDWVQRLLWAGWALHGQSADATRAVREMATPGCAPLEAPVVIVAGGTDDRVEEHMRTYAELLHAAFEDFHGTVVSGGTAQGIPGIVGDLAESSGGRLQAIGYLPTVVPSDADVDENRERYREIRRTGGDGFSPLEPLQNWIDIVASGLAPSEVRVLGINGGRIAAAEYRIALALGATVGIVEDSGREAGRLVSDEKWLAAQHLVALPADAETVRAFLRPGEEAFSPDVLETVAMAIHEAYRDERRREGLDAEDSMAEWTQLAPNLRSSNVAQAQHIGEKLRRIGCVAVPLADAPTDPVELTPEELEALAEMEHGRWVAERLLDGWRWGAARDVANRTNPSLVPWRDLTEEVQELDRQTVRKIPGFLRLAGFAMARAGGRDG